MRSLSLAIPLLIVACVQHVPTYATEDDVVRLEPAALAGDRAAIRALFAMCADGAAVAESIDDLLGKTVRVAPRVFLEELAISGRGEQVRREGARALCLPHLLCCNFDLVDEFDARARESEARKMAILQVDEPGLRQLRDACVEVLDSDVRSMRKIEGSGR
jgi:hypothetical protein